MSTASIIDLAAYRRQLRPSVKSEPAVLAQLLVSERMFGDHLPFVSAWPIWEGGRDLP